MRFTTSLVVTVLALLGVPASSAAQGLPVPGPCVDGTLPGGALSRMCVPAAGWNGQLVIWAHGYIAFDEPLDFYHVELSDGTSLATLAQSLGFAFATTSYRQNGLAILEGVADIQELLAHFNAAAPAPATRTFLAGASEGGIIAALLAERAPSLFTGVLSACGPVGSFVGQINYIGDFRALFDVYFPGVLPGSATVVPESLIASWSSTYEPAVAAAVRAHPAKAIELMRVAGAAHDPADIETVVSTAVNVLWYNVYGTNDATAKLGGNPYDNRRRWYSGSSSDLLLNLFVRRYTADAAALAALAPYETSGRPGTRTVMLHTTGDEVIPYAHQWLYRLKAVSAGTAPPLLPVNRYGHCDFTPGEILGSFLYLIATS